MILLLVALWLAGLVWYAENLPRAPAADTRSTDGIVVLTGGQNRLQEAVDLLAEGRGGRLLISGVNAEIGDPQLKATLGLADRPGRDLFACCIDVGRHALDTVGNAREIVEWAASHDYRSLRVVTAGYHMPRSLVEIRRLAPDLELIAQPVFSDAVKLESWWQYPGTAQVVAGEYNKYLVTLAKTHLVDRVAGSMGS